MVRPARELDLDIPAMAKRMQNLGIVSNNAWLLHVQLHTLKDGALAGFTLFRDGRAVFRGVKDAAEARTAYARYIGA
jgi:adenylyltransferase/sulfurtransferase